MSEHEWDVLDNSEESREEREHRERDAERAAQREQYRIEREERETRRQERRRAAGYFEPSGLDDDTISRNFPRLARWIAEDAEAEANGIGGHLYRQGQQQLVGAWSANRLIWICHNFGAFGYKASNDCSELFKCYGCSSRNVDILRAGEVSIAVRDLAIGTHMEEVYSERRERFRRQRAERSAERRRTQGTS